MMYSFWIFHKVLKIVDSHDGLVVWQFRRNSNYVKNWKIQYLFFTENHYKKSCKRLNFRCIILFFVNKRDTHPMYIYKRTKNLQK